MQWVQSLVTGSGINWSQVLQGPSRSRVATKWVEQSTDETSMGSVMRIRRRYLGDLLPPPLVGVYRRYFVWIVPTVRYAMSRRRTSAPLTVLISSFEHAYVQNMRRAVSGSVLFVPIRQHHQFALPLKFIRADIFHLHFVDELGFDLERTTALIAELKRARVKIVWTAHDLTPHTKDHGRYDPIFAAWAAAADGVIHHSHFGETLMRQRYDFRPDAVHTVITNRYRREHSNLAVLKQRSSIEAEWGLTPTPIRIGLLGSPRFERKVMDFLRGVTMSTSHDFQVVCWSLRPTDIAPRDPRIAIAEAHRFTNYEVHERRLAICDLIALPFDPDGEMLTSGFVSDANAMGLGLLVSDWEFLRETCGDAAIACGHTAETVAECLNKLTVSDVQAAKEASLSLRETRSWETAREPILEFYRSVMTSPQTCP